MSPGRNQAEIDWLTRKPMGDDIYDCTHPTEQLMVGEDGFVFCWSCQGAVVGAERTAVLRREKRLRSWWSRLPFIGRGSRANAGVSRPK